MSLEAQPHARIPVLLLAPEEAEAQRIQREFAEELDVTGPATAEQALAICKQPPVPFTAILNAADPASGLGLRLVRILKDEMQLERPCSGSPKIGAPRPCARCCWSGRAARCLPPAGSRSACSRGCIFWPGPSPCRWTAAAPTPCACR